MYSKCLWNHALQCKTRNGMLQKRKVFLSGKETRLPVICCSNWSQQLINLTLFTDVSPREQLALVHAFKLPTPYVIVKECINVSIAAQDSTEHGIDTWPGLYLSFRQQQLTSCKAGKVLTPIRSAPVPPPPPPHWNAGFTGPLFCLASSAFIAVTAAACKSWGNVKMWGTTREWQCRGAAGSNRRMISRVLFYARLAACDSSQAGIVCVSSIQLLQ